MRGPSKVPGMTEVPTGERLPGAGLHFPRTEDLAGSSKINVLQRMLDSNNNIIFTVGVTAVAIAAPFVAFKQELFDK